jgi:DNA-binding NtrC family response regulator
VQPLAGVTILAVDDDATVLHVVTEMLTLAGATVQSSRSGVEAQRVAAGMPTCDLVLIDIVLPDVVGLELVDVLRRWHPAAKVILMSGNLNEVSAPPGVPSLQKPFKLAALVALVERTLRP